MEFPTTNALALSSFGDIFQFSSTEKVCNIIVEESYRFPQPNLALSYLLDFH